MTVFIFGANGMLGVYVSKYLQQHNFNVIPLTRKEYDILNVTSGDLDMFLRSYNISSTDIVINCAGVIPQSSKSTIPAQTYYTVNSIFPVILGGICDKIGAHLIHITTDCVFSGKGGNYNESAVHDETNNYGVSKSLGELHTNSTIIRTSIIGEDTRNKYSLLEWVKSNENGTIHGYTNHIWNGVTCLELAKIINYLIVNKIYWKNVRHIFSPTSVTKFELVRMINSAFDLNICVNSIQTPISIDKTISTKFEEIEMLNIPELPIQLKELSEFKL